MAFTPTILGCVWLDGPGGMERGRHIFYTVWIGVTWGRGEPQRIFWWQRCPPKTNGWIRPRPSRGRKKSCCLLPYPLSFLSWRRRKVRRRRRRAEQAVRPSVRPSRRPRAGSRPSVRPGVQSRGQQAVHPSVRPAVQSRGQQTQASGRPSRRRRAAVRPGVRPSRRPSKRTGPIVQRPSVQALDSKNWYFSMRLFIVLLDQGNRCLR
jgi:hypothetical protein